jgi:GNAT superfamily N-acetyltransferase
MPSDVSCTLISTPDERDEAIRFLAARGTLANAMLIRDLCATTDGTQGERKIAVCRRGRSVAGVASMPDRGGAVPDEFWDWPVYLDAVDRESAAVLVGVLPTRVALAVWLNWPHLQGYFGRLPGATRRMHLLCFTVSPEDFRPVSSGQVRRLTKADAGLFAGSERQPPDDFLSSGNNAWGLVRNGRVVTSAVLRALIPGTAGLAQGVAAICGLYTESVYRRQGLARGLVSHLTELVLGEGAAPIYSATVENIASQGVARGLGYRQYGEEIGYEWRGA